MELFIYIAVSNTQLVTMAGRGVDLDSQTITMVKSGENIDKILTHFTEYVQHKSDSLPQSDKDECVGCLWNKLFCSAVQFNHDDLAENVVKESTFKLWVKRWSQNTKFYGVRNRLCRFACYNTVVMCTYGIHRYT